MIYAYPVQCCSVVRGQGGLLAAWFSKPPKKVRSTGDERSLRTSMRSRRPWVDVLRVDQSLSWESKTSDLDDLAYKNLDLMGIVIEPTDDLIRLQQRMINAIVPFAVEKGTGQAISQPTVNHAHNCVGPRTGMNNHLL